MRVNTNLFWILTVFMLLAAAVYTFWSVIDTNSVEWVGTVGIALAGLLSAFLAFYLRLSHRSQGAELPEDRLDANIDDGDPEIGFFSPWSWWPLVLAFSCALMVLGLAVGVWIAFIGVVVLIVAIVGWTYEYYRGYFAR